MGKKKAAAQKRPLHSNRFPILVSYAFMREWKQPNIDLMMANKNCDLLIDSGAFTAKTIGAVIDLDKYMEFLDENKAGIFRYFALDVVGEPKKTADNLRIMRAAGFDPVPVHVLGDEQKEMDALFAETDYVGCAGLRRPGRGHCKPDYLRQKMEWAKGRDVHWLGYTNKRQALKHMPYSMDSSNFNNTFIFGDVYVYRGRGQFKVYKWQTRADMFRDPFAMKLAADLGFSHSALAKRENWLKRGSMVARLTIDSFVRYSIELQFEKKVRHFNAAMFVGQDGCILPSIDRIYAELGIKV